VRSSEAEYRALAEQAAAFLSRPEERPPESAGWAPAWVGAADGARGVVADQGPDGLELYPVREGAVMEEAGVRVEGGRLEEAVSRLRWPVPEAPRDDRRWLSSWLHAPKRRGIYLVVDESEGAARLAQRIAAATDVVT
jgi:hypothetical protein